MTDIFAPEALSRIDAFYDATLKPKLDAIDDRRRQVRWLIIKALIVVLPPIGFLIAGDLLDSILPFNSSAGTAEARTLLTPAMMEHLLALRRHAGMPVFLAFKDRRAYVGVHYGRTLFEPGVARSTSKDAVREIAGNFALVETIVRELNVNAGASSMAADDSLLRGPDIVPHPLTRMAADKAGTLTTSDVWAMASASVDDSAKDGDAPVPRPERTRIRLEQGPASCRSPTDCGWGSG